LTRWLPVLRAAVEILNAKGEGAKTETEMCYNFQVKGCYVTYEI